MQAKYGFKAVQFHAKDFADKQAFKAKHGSDLYLVDIDEYDRICKVRHLHIVLHSLANCHLTNAHKIALKMLDLLRASRRNALQVEPFNRALLETEADVMINGRRQDHGFERAHLEVSSSVHLGSWQMRAINCLLILSIWCMPAALLLRLRLPAQCCQSEQQFNDGSLKGHVRHLIMLLMPLPADQVFEGGTPVKCNPLAYWTFKDCFDYLESENLEKHPLHDQASLKSHF